VVWKFRVAVRSASGEGVRAVNTTRPVVPPIDTSVGAGGSASVGYNAGTESTRRRYQNTKCKSSTISCSDPMYRAIEDSYGSYVKRT
jgi:hypothetical protein